MKWYHYSRHAAHGFLALLLLLGGPVALGHAIWPDVGAGVGAGVGLLSLGAYAGWRAWYYRRGSAWIEVGRRHGLRPMYSGQAPAMPFQGYEEAGHLLTGEFEGVPIMAGDRRERYWMYHSEPNLDSYSSEDRRVSDPIPIETFIAFRLPGLSSAPCALGRRRGLFCEPPPRLEATLAVMLQAWSTSHPQWRVECAGEWIVLMRPHVVSSPAAFDGALVMARQFAAKLGITRTRV